MYTECPNCATIFKVTAEQLNAAQGKVRCGRCNTVFSAIGNLTDGYGEQDEAVDQNDNDRPSALAQGHESSQFVSPAEPSLDVADKNIEGLNHSTQQAESSFEEDMAALKDFLDSDDALDIPTDDKKQQAADEQLLNELSALDLDTDEQNFRVPPTISKLEAFGDDMDDEKMVPQKIQGEQIISDVAPSFEEALSASKAQISEIKSQKNIKQTEEDNGTDLTHAPDRFVLEELGGESEKPSTNWLRRALWGGMIGFLLILLVGQLVYINREQLAENPEAMPMVNALCAVIRPFKSCENPRNISQVELLNRDVRSHPKSKNALLITATVINKADFIQPYPVLVMSFSGINDELIAQRSFQPSEYLGKEVVIEEGMPVNVPVRIMLEIVDPGEEAVNFEFTFR